MAPKLKHLGHQSSQNKAQAGITMEELKALTAARLRFESFNRIENEGMRTSNSDLVISDTRYLHRIDQHSITMAELKKMTEMRLELDHNKTKSDENKSRALSPQSYKNQLNSSSTNTAAPRDSIIECF